jgi:hypothetical protein
MILLFLLLFLGQIPVQPTPQELIKSATMRPWPGENRPFLPAISSAMRDEIVYEINSSIQVRQSYEKLNTAHRRNIEWFEGVAGLEKEKAIWALLSCLVHPHVDVQGHALDSLARIKDKRTVPFLLIYAEYMAVYVDGSESATLHGLLQQGIAKTISTITGVKWVLDNGQDPEKLKQGIKRWRKWENEHLP